jgi:hypothetical protein
LVLPSQTPHETCVIALVNREKKEIRALKRMFSKSPNWAVLRATRQTDTPSHTISSRWKLLAFLLRIGK